MNIELLHMGSLAVALDFKQLQVSLEEKLVWLASTAPPPKVLSFNVYQGTFPIHFLDFIIDHALSTFQFLVKKVVRKTR